MIDFPILDAFPSLASPVFLCTEHKTSDANNTKIDIGHKSNTGSHAGNVLNLSSARLLPGPFLWRHGSDCGTLKVIFGLRSSSRTGGQQRASTPISRILILSNNIPDAIMKKLPPPRYGRCGNNVAPPLQALPVRPRVTKCNQRCNYKIIL